MTAIGVVCESCGHERVAWDPPVSTSVVAGVYIGRCGGCGKGSRVFRRPSNVTPLPTARRTDPATSHAAAASVRNPELDRARVYAALAEGPMTDEQILERCRAHYAPQISPSGARTRRSELVRTGLVRDSGRRTRLSSGRLAIIWERTEAD